MNVPLTKSPEMAAIITVYTLRISMIKEPLIPGIIIATAPRRPPIKSFKTSFSEISGKIPVVSVELSPYFTCKYWKKMINAIPIKISKTKIKFFTKKTVIF